MRFKQVFVNRLFMYVNGPSNSKGCIPDIFSITCKYNLTKHITDYIGGSVFKSKTVWIILLNVQLTSTFKMNGLQRPENVQMHSLAIRTMYDLVLSKTL